MPVIKDWVIIPSNFSASQHLCKNHNFLSAIKLKDSSIIMSIFDQWRFNRIMSCLIQLLRITLKNCRCLLNVWRILVSLILYLCRSQFRWTGWYLLLLLLFTTNRRRLSHFRLNLTRLTVWWRNSSPKFYSYR